MLRKIFAYIIFAAIVAAALAFDVAPNRPAIIGVATITMVAAVAIDVWKFLYLPRYQPPMSGSHTDLFWQEWLVDIVSRDDPDGVTSRELWDWIRRDRQAHKIWRSPADLFRTLRHLTTIGAITQPAMFGPYCGTQEDDEQEAAGVPS